MLEEQHGNLGKTSDAKKINEFRNVVDGSIAAAQQIYGIDQTTIISYDLRNKWNGYFSVLGYSAEDAIEYTVENFGLTRSQAIRLVAAVPIVNDMKVNKKLVLEEEAAYDYFITDVMIESYAVHKGWDPNDTVNRGLSKEALLDVVQNMRSKLESQT